MRETARRNWGHTGFAAHQTAVTSLADAEARLTGANADTSEEDLIAALASAANPNCQPSLAQGIISPVALAGAKALVGFADADGLTDAYVSQFTAPEHTPETATPAEPVEPDSTTEP